MVHPEKRTNSMVFLLGDLLWRTVSVGEKKFFPNGSFYTYHKGKHEIGITAKINKGLLLTIKNISN